MTPWQRWQDHKPDFERLTDKLDSRRFQSDLRKRYGKDPEFRDLVESDEEPPGWAEP